MSGLGLEWWEGVDRRELLVALRETLPRGGCVVAVGPARSGQMTASRLCRSFLVERGFSVVWVPPSPGIASTPRDALLRAWEEAAPPVPVGQLGPWVTQRRHITMHEIIDQLVAITQSGPSRRAFVFADIDEAGPIAPHAVGHFATLASRAQCPVLVTSSTEADTDWLAAPEIRVEKLRPLTVAEIREFVALSRELVDLAPGDLDALVHSMTAGSSSGQTVDAETAYDILQAVGPQ
jgi:hypothetical protein